MLVVHPLKRRHIYIVLSFTSIILIMKYSNNKGNIFDSFGNKSGFNLIELGKGKVFLKVKS